MQTSTEFNAVKVRSTVSRGGAVIVLTSTALLIALALGLFFLPHLELWYALLMLTAVMGIVIGWARLAEPVFFLQYDQEGVRYQHRHGSWLLPWSALLYSGVPNLNEQPMAYIGFRVMNYEPFLQTLPLRLAVRIMTEQRALYLEAVRQACVSGQCASELLNESADFRAGGAVYHGIKAAFGRRMQHLLQATGYDLLIPVQMSGEQAQQLCRHINQSRLQLIHNTVT